MQGAITAFGFEIVILLAKPLIDEDIARWVAIGGTDFVIALLVVARWILGKGEHAIDDKSYGAQQSTMTLTCCHCWKQFELHGELAEKLSGSTRLSRNNAGQRSGRMR